MSRLIEMGTLIERASLRADKALDKDDHILSAEWRALVSEVWGTEVFSTVAGVGLRYFETSSDLTSDGTAYVTEPANLLSHVRLDYIDGAGRHYELIQLDEYDEALFAGGSAGGRAYFFVAADNRIYLYPTPASGQTYRLLYIPQAPDVSGFADDECVDCVTIDGEAAVIWGVAGLAKAKAAQGVELYEMKREKHKERLLDWALQRFQTQPRVRRYRNDEIDFANFDPADWRWSR